MTASDTAPTDAAASPAAASATSPRAPAAASAAAPPRNGTPPKRRKALLGVATVVALAALGYGVYWALFLRNFESTDNAYVQAPLVQITPQIGGTVVQVGVDDTERVKTGQVLVRLDPGDARLALAQAEAQLAQTVREVRGLYANDHTLAAQIAQRQADLQRTEIGRAHV